MDKQSKTWKEEAEGHRLWLFISLLNKTYGTDFVISGPGAQDSIVDRTADSVSGKWKSLLLQETEAINFEGYLPTSSRAKIFNANIFETLKKSVEAKNKKYGISAKGVILVVSVMVPQSWFSDIVPTEIVGDTCFLGIYCVGLNNPNFIAVLKEATLLTK